MCEIIQGGFTRTGTMFEVHFNKRTEDLAGVKNTWWRIKNVLTWSFGSSSQNAPQAKDNGSLVLLHNLCTETNRINSLLMSLFYLTPTGVIGY